MVQIVYDPKNNYPEVFYKNIESIKSSGQALTRTVGALIEKYVDDRQAGSLEDYKPYMERWAYKRGEHLNINKKKDEI